MKHFNFLSNFRWFTTVILLITLGVGSVRATDPTILFQETFGDNGSGKSSNTAIADATCYTASTSYFTTGHQTSAVSNYSSEDGTKVGKNNVAPSGNEGASGNSAIWRQGAASQTDKDFFTIQNINISGYSSLSLKFNLYYTDGKGAGKTNTITVKYKIDSGSETSITLDNSPGATTWTWCSGSISGTGNSLQLKFYHTTNGGYTARVDDIILTGTAAASCSADPSIGDASLNGSFNMTTTTSAIGVASGTCSTGNAACDWTDYGFVWSDGANTTTPTVGETNCNKVPVDDKGSATSWTGSVTPSNSTTPTTWTTGHTYYVRTYGKNSKESASYYYSTNAWSFTPYLVTFYKNDGSATTSTQYVQGGVSTNLTSNSFSRTGYTFNDWNTDADGTSGTGYTNGQSVNLSANLTLYAKWNAKTYNITLDREGATTGATGVTMTYNSSSFTGWSAPSKTGYTFGGYWTEDNGTGTMVIDASGNLQAGVTNYTGAGGIWTKDATCTLYAKWTAINYSVTWMVNGVAYTPKTTTGEGTDGSANADYGTQVSALPTAPDPGDYCGQVFMGWTTTNIGATGWDKDDDADDISDLNLFTTAAGSPTIEGATIFYAVFADYTTD